MKVILDNPDWMLVKAEVFNGGERTDHAYLEKDNVVYDTILNLFFDKEQLYKYICPQNIRIYSREDIANMMCYKTRYHLDEKE